MADKPISELIATTQVLPSDLFVLEQAGVAKKLTGQILENWLVSLANGHGGIQTVAKTRTSGLVDTYTITYADETTSTFTVTNGKAIASITDYWAVSSSASTEPSDYETTVPTLTSTNKYLWHYSIINYNSGSPTETEHGIIGVYGDTGLQTYVHIKWSAVPNPTAADLGDVPEAYIGIYSGTSATAPTTPEAYAWFLYKGEKGDTGDPATVEETEIVYQKGTSGTDIPTGTWTTTIPTVPQGQFLWTRRTVTFNSGDPIVDYSVTRMGVDGSGTVASVNGQDPDLAGNVEINAGDINVDDSEEEPITVAEVLSTQSQQLSQQSQQISNLSALLTAVLPAEYDPTGTYAVGNVCMHNGLMYQATQATSGTWNPAHWSQVRINNVAVLSYTEV